MDFLNSIPIQWVNGGLTLVIFWGLFTGALGTRKELDGKDETIRWLRETNDELMQQNKDLILGTKVATDAFEKVSQAAVIAAEGEGA